MTENGTFKLINAILSHLFAPEYRRFQKNIDKIHEGNQEILGQKLDGFVYEGKFYKPSYAATGGGLRKSLALRMWPEMQEHLRDVKEVELDKSQINQLLSRLLDNCFNRQDLRDAIPDCIKDIMPPDVSSLERCRLPTFFLNHPRDFRLYEKVLPRIEFYSATKYIY